MPLGQDCHVDGLPVLDLAEQPSLQLDLLCDAVDGSQQHRVVLGRAGFVQDFEADAVDRAQLSNDVDRVPVLLRFDLLVVPSEVDRMSIRRRIGRAAG
ncbi:MAG: hypothetical protein HC897_02880 [Thermoanaerobaculia bacterium]|nr:hypothetical protein [Thermoanaerobaculia bacterium]